VLFRRGLDHFDFQEDGHLVADDNTTGFQGSIPGQTEILAVDLRRGRGAAPDIAQGSLLS